MRLIAYIEDYGSRQFDLVGGSVLVETITEKLDSFSFNLTNLSTKLNLRPFQFVRIVDIDEDGTFNRLFCIDNFTEEIVNISNVVGKIQHYEYTISLMSLMKVLEKIQLPNRTIIHGTTTKKLNQVIKEFLELYLPRVKAVSVGGSLYLYKPLFTYTNLINDEKFNVNCPDLSFNSPSLREVLTALMLYVGCLPTFNNYEITYIDLRKPTTEFSVPIGKKFLITSSNSSDSYVNTLVSPISKVLDTNNTIRNEILGFRDSENIFLKQAENLTLTTDFPIAKVNKLAFYYVQPYEVNLRNYAMPYDSCFTKDNNRKVKVNFPTSLGASVHIVVKFYSLKCQYLHTEYYDREATLYFDGDISTGVEYIYENPNSNTIVPNGECIYNFVYIRYTINGKDYIYDTLSTTANDEEVDFQVFSLFENDITTLVKEKQERALLSKDFRPVSEYASSITIDTLAENYYTTLEFTYGENQIKGFSNHWDFFAYFYTDVAITIDMIFKTCFTLNNQVYYTLDDKSKSAIEELEWFAETTDTQVANAYLIRAFFPDQTDLVNPTIYGYNDGVCSYALYFFSIEYVPFNELTAKTHKEVEIPIELAQTDTQEASILMFDEFGVREQQKANRLGNNILSITQHNALISELNDIGNSPNSELLEYSDSVVFQKQTQFFKDFCNANYTASKDYILQNYFTALQSKYRAYEYVSRSQSILRKENVNAYVRIGYDYLYCASDKMYSTDYCFLASALIPDEKYKISYQVEQAYAYTKLDKSDLFYGLFKKDASVLTNETTLFITYNSLDNASFGEYIVRLSDLTQAEAEDLASANGLIQSRYIQNVDDSYNGYARDYGVNHYTAFINNSLFSLNRTYSKLQLQNLIYASVDLPKVDSIFEVNSQTMVFALNDYTISNSHGATFTPRLYYKSLDERINETAQFEYYSNESTINFTKHLIEYNSLKQTHNFELKLRYLSSLDTLSDLWRDTSIGSLEDCTITNDTPNNLKRCMCAITISTSAFATGNVALCLVDTINNKFTDLLSFRLIDNTRTIYFSINDTKTDRVYALNSTSGLYELSKSAKVGTLDTIISDREIN